jgi:hypothetical protein
MFTTLPASAQGRLIATISKQNHTGKYLFMLPSPS